MIISSRIHFLQYLKFVDLKPQRFSPIQTNRRHFFRISNIFGVFHSPVYLTTYCVRVFRPWLVYFWSFCQQHYLSLFREISVTDCNRAYCRSDVKRTILQESFHKSITTLRDVIYLQSQVLYCHSPLSFDTLSIPSILYHCKKYWTSLCLLFPKIGQRLFELYCSYQCASNALWSIARTRQRRGHIYLGQL
mgnify:CR=1 FL=1